MIRVMEARGCHAPPQNKIVISSAITPEQEREFRALGCHILPKPFQLEELGRMVKECEANTPPGRILVPLEELWKTVRHH
jgi:hypothetical protein